MCVDGAYNYQTCLLWRSHKDLPLTCKSSLNDSIRKCMHACIQAFNSIAFRSVDVLDDLASETDSKVQIVHVKTGGAVLVDL